MIPSLKSDTGGKTVRITKIRTLGPTTIENSNCFKFYENFDFAILLHQDWEINVTSMLKRKNGKNTDTVVPVNHKMPHFSGHRNTISRYHVYANS